MDEPHIEQATLEDLPQLTDLLFDLFTKEADFVPNRAKQMRGLRLILEQPNRGRIFVLRQNGTILGMINLLFTISTAEGGFVILLEDVIVHHDYRGRGFGARLGRGATFCAGRRRLFCWRGRMSGFETCTTQAQPW